MVELALLAPLGLLVAFGFVDVGRLQQTRSTIDFGAREGLTLAVAQPCNTVTGNVGGTCGTGGPGGETVCSLVAADVRHEVVCNDGTDQPDIPATADAGSVYLQVDALDTCADTALPHSRNTPRIAEVGRAIRVTVISFFTALTPVGFPSPIRMIATACGAQTW